MNPLAVYHGFLFHNASLSLKQAQLRRQIIILPQKRTQTNQQVKKTRTQVSFIIMSNLYFNHFYRYILELVSL